MEFDTRSDELNSDPGSSPCGKLIGLLLLTSHTGIDFEQFLMQGSSSSTVKLAENAAVEPGTDDVEFTLMMFIHMNQFKEFSQVYKRYKA